MAYQSRRVLSSFVEAAARAIPDAELIIVDNASTDGCAAAVSDHPQVQVVTSSVNGGFGRGCNIGARAATGEWIIFANPDLSLESVDTRGLPGLRPFGLGAGSISAPHGAHVRGTRPTGSLASDWSREVLHRYVPRACSRLLPTRTWPRQWASGALLMARRDEFRQIGGFDERFFLYHEDRDLGTRYRRDGMRIRSVAGVRGAHLHGQSSGDAPTAAGQAWSFVSWIEYLAIWRGIDVARSQGCLAVGVLRRIQRLSSRLSGSTTMKRKADETTELLERITRFPHFLPPTPDSDPFYPNARAALADVLE